MLYQLSYRPYVSSVPSVRIRRIRRYVDIAVVAGPDHA